MFEECFGEGPFIFRLNDNGAGPLLLTQVCLERGWREYNSENGDHWNLWWRTSGFSVSHHKSLYAWQFINHIPKGSAICRKDNLVRYLRCMKKVYGSIYDFSPDGFNLPLEYTKLAAECSKCRPFTARNDIDLYYEDKPVWICKPVAQSQGRGIFLFRKLSELTYDSNTIVQKYIEKPLLIGGYKFDLRLYVCIPSYHPVTIYLYREGLARFGTDKFSLNDLKNPYRHLTNSSINKCGPGYTEMKDRIGAGCKWTFRQLRRYFQQAGISDWLLWQKISSLIILTLLSHIQQVPQTVNCFEFFGFDVLIDSTLRPWLLEVNLSPALGNDCDADRTVKKPMLHDMFDLLGLPLYNTGLCIYHIWNDDDENKLVEEDQKRAIKPSQAVVNAAGRWRKKHRKMSARSISRSKSANKVTKNNLNQNNLKTYNYTNKWGNGKDWKNAPAEEGGWIRLWPMNSRVNYNNENMSVNSKVKFMVSEVNKFSKVAKEIFKRYPAASECQLNEFLQQKFDLNRDVWIPPI
ncbi:probable tubulin polyglutamylase TTLL2 [Onthophagus taurus]|uniref:probable tubulin polyglutamylase TTLL2 n=1 Tax=Onthophagus taurus TaxID=166361 RepID=UPI000C20F53A|nr:probable tubulin polyglutamylase TTLL2 [Onthophagus taurus]